MKKRRKRYKGGWKSTTLAWENKVPLKMIQTFFEKGLKSPLLEVPDQRTVMGNILLSLGDLSWDFKEKLVPK